MGIRRRKAGVRRNKGKREVSMAFREPQRAYDDRNLQELYEKGFWRGYYTRIGSLNAIPIEDMLDDQEEKDAILEGFEDGEAARGEDETNGIRIPVEWQKDDDEPTDFVNGSAGQ